MTDYKIHDPDQQSNDTPLQENGGASLPAVVTRDASSVTSFVVTRPDPFFVTQLIATAVQMPQTRTLRRASAEDAQTSYRSTAKQSRQRPASRAISRVA